MIEQLSLFPEFESLTPFVETTSLTQECQRIEKKFAPLMREELNLGQFVSYVGNKKLPVLRLYRYKEAFSCGFVRDFISRLKLTKEDYLFEPFCGMGTTLFAAMQDNIPAIGIDRLPIAQFIAQTLPLFCLVEPRELRETFENLKPLVTHASLADVALDVKIMKVAFPETTLLSLRRWKGAIDSLSPPMRDIFLLLFLSILEPCSYTAKDGQFLRIKRDKIIPDPATILEHKVGEAQRDIESLTYLWKKRERRQLVSVYLADARDLSTVKFERQPTAIITSPPYPNRYDYTRSYSLELCFSFVRNFEELKALRFGVLRSHIESRVSEIDKPPHPAISEVVALLKNERKSLNNPRIPDMLTAYFVDMQKVIGEWSRVLVPGGKVAMIVDNVRFAGKTIPVDLVLSEMAEEAGFRVKEIIIARYKGNSSQQMGKYGRFPVRESIVVWGKER